MFHLNGFFQLCASSDLIVKHLTDNESNFEYPLSNKLEAAEFCSQSDQAVSYAAIT